MRHLFGEWLVEVDCDVAEVWATLVVLNNELLDDEFEGLPPSRTTITIADASSYAVLLWQFVHAKALDAFHMHSTVSLENAVVLLIPLLCTYSVLSIKPGPKRFDVNCHFHL